MIFSILTLFPEMFAGPFDHSIIKRAYKKEIIKINLINIRDFATDKYGTVDDRPYGGGIGMILKVDVVDQAINFAKQQHPSLASHTLLLDPKGKIFTQTTAIKYSKIAHLILICGHYEGVDARVNTFVDEIVSIGDFILTGGELPAMVIIDSIARLVKGVLPETATTTESFTKNLLEAPHYTKPQEYQGLFVPEVLLSGNHKNIEKWRSDSAKVITEIRSKKLK